MSGVIDLHTHTDYSDGGLSPKGVVEFAVLCGLRAIAITDHDTVDGVEEALQAGEEFGIEVVPGIELSCQSDTHMLGYYINHLDKNLAVALETLKLARKQSMVDKVDFLNKSGVNINFTDIEKVSKNNNLCKMHLELALINNGYSKTKTRKFMDQVKSSSGNVARVKPSTEEAIKIIQKAKGVPVYAHPGKSKLSIEEIDKKVAYLVENGLMGIEVHHSKHDAEMTQNLLDIAGKYKLLISGGSDFHGTGRDKVQIGTGLGNLNISYELLRRIKKARGVI